MLVYIPSACCGNNHTLMSDCAIVLLLTTIDTELEALCGVVKAGVLHGRRVPSSEYMDKLWLHENCRFAPMALLIDQTSESGIPNCGRDWDAIK